MSKHKNSELDVEWLREHMVYVPETGTFMWKVRGPGRTVGKVLGTKNWDGYLSIKVMGTFYYAHRLAWFYAHGAWPAKAIDHIDGNRSNNALANLRPATHSQNSVRKKTVRHVAPARGVMPQGTGFVARIHYDGKRHYLGYFPTLAAASAAYEAKARELHGEFAHQEPVHKWDAEVAEAVKRAPHRDWLLAATPGFGVHQYG